VARTQAPGLDLEDGAVLEYRRPTAVTHESGLPHEATPAAGKLRALIKSSWAPLISSKIAGNSFLISLRDRSAWSRKAGSVIAAAITPSNLKLSSASNSRCDHDRKKASDCSTLNSVFSIAFSPKKVLSNHRAARATDARGSVSLTVVSSRGAASHASKEWPHSEHKTTGSLCLSANAPIGSMREQSRARGTPQR
jgi:hypothetical protein